MALTTGASQDVGTDGASPSLSADGRYLTFNRYSSNATWQTVLRDRTAGTTTEVDVSAAGSIVDVPWKGAELGGMSQDGSLVSFASAAPDLVEGDTNAMADVFTRRMHS